MILTRNLGRVTRDTLVGLTAFTVVGVGACSSTETSPPPPPTEIVMPDLVGKYWVDAQPQLDAVGWRGVLVKEPDIPAGPQDHNRVLSQDPAPGEHLNPASPITLRFGS